MAIPQAYKEAFEIIFRPHKEEEIIFERMSGKRSPRLAFWDIFLITFTPKLSSPNTRKMRVMKFM